MRILLTTTFGVTLLALAGCNSSPQPDVAVAYGKQWGAVTTSRSSPCPSIEGVWHLANLSAGSLLLDDGQPVAHFRWFGGKLFGLTVNQKSFIAIEPRQLGTVVYLADQIPKGAGSRSMLGYTTLSDAEMPCVGQGWRRVETTDHSLNDAAARVLKLVPEKPSKIMQTNFIARTANHELLLAARIDFEGTNREDEAVKGGYWHFVKMPRLHETPKDQGFKS